ncbi:MAG: IS3 family transposase [Bdellovibrionales bacterium]|nr:IS3 family transposase [Bdellovibrionales bacterium]
MLQQDFSAERPNDRVGDVTYVRTKEGWLYLATVIDLFSRKVVGYAMSNRNDARLACTALKMALLRKQMPESFVYHSDRGSVYDSRAFRELLAANNITLSMSRKGNCYDNSVAESFFHTIKVELIFRMEYKSRLSALASITNWIERFYNSSRMHSSLGYNSPDEFEQIHQDTNLQR